jgi:hypothetical protein
MRFLFTQKMTEYTPIEAETKEEAWEIFCSGYVSHKECDYEDAEMTEEVTKPMGQRIQYEAATLDGESEQFRVEESA